MKTFTNENVNLDILKDRAHNLRWAEVPDGVIPLTAADSDFPCAPEIVDTLKEYIKDGYFPYVENRGMPEFKNSLAKFFNERKNEHVNPEYILPIDSAARGMNIIAHSFIEPGDECIVFDPVDFLFRTNMEDAGGVIKLFPSNLKEDRISLEGLEDYITPKTKMIGFCNPHNPMGMLYSKDDLKYLLDLSEKYGFYIMNDEIWSDIVYPGNNFNSLLEFGPEMNKRTLSVYGFSKTFGVAGLRIGCIFATNQENYEKLAQTSMVDQTIGGINLLSQIAGIACLTKSLYRVDEYVEHITANRDYALDRLNKMPLIKCHKPQATFVLFPDISEVGMNPVDFVNLLKEEYKIAIVPGGKRFFGPGSEGHVRICLATSHEILKEGLDRIEKCLNDIKNK